MQRYFSFDKELTLTQNDKHHIINVMRMKKGDKIVIVYDKVNYLCEITEISKKDVFTKKIGEIEENNELSKKLILAFSLVNETKTDLILQKGCELGVSEFIPIITERCKVKLNNKENKKIERWKKIIKEAAEQSHRNILPDLNKILTIDELCKLPFDLKILCSTKEKEKNIKNVLQNSTKCDTIIIVVGPEGGISDLEEERLNKNGYISTSLGSTILRTETAPIFAVSAIRYNLMR